MLGRATIDEFTLHLEALRRYAWSLTRCRHRADDLAQEAVAKAIASVGTLHPGAPVRPWLFRILRNLHVSQFRSDRRRDSAAAELAGGEETIAPPGQLDRLELQNVLAALDELPQAQREAITLIALEELSYAEAAEVLGIPLGTLMSRLARGREALRQRLEGARPARLYVVGGRHE
jgi:RNA polymerase sigma factor (sigma-70 family)